MNIKKMNQQDQVMIRDAKINNQNYSISWLAPVYHQDLLVCIRSSWLSLEKIINRLEEHGDENRYQDNEVYWQKVTRQTSVQIPTSTIKPPIDIVLLPVTSSEVLVPVDEMELTKVSKTIKGIIKCNKKRETSLFSATETFSFNNDSLPVTKNEIVAEYIIGNLRYPVTAEMFGKKICVQIPKTETCQLCITKKINNKYNLIKEE